MSDEIFVENKLEKEWIKTFWTKCILYAFSSYMVKISSLFYMFVDWKKIRILQNSVSQYLSLTLLKHNAIKIQLKKFLTPPISLQTDIRHLRPYWHRNSKLDIKLDSKCPGRINYSEPSNKSGGWYNRGGLRVSKN